MHASAALFGYTTLLGTPLFVGGKPRGWRLLQVAARESYYLEKQRSTQRASPVLSCEMKILLAGKVGETAHLHRRWKWKGGADIGGHMLKPKTNTQQPLPLSVSRSRIFRAICKRKISTKNPKANRRSSLRKMWKEYL